MTGTMEAKHVTEGDTLLNIDGGYVYEVEVDEYDVTIHFYDTNGNEAVLFVAPDFPLGVQQGEPV